MNGRAGGTAAIRPIGREDLEARIAQEVPNNFSLDGGYALVNVLPPDEYRAGHIPGSINIPRGREDWFEEQFQKDKEIVLYCASPDCEAAAAVARELASRGYRHLVHYRGGMSDWRHAGNEIDRGRA